MMLRSYLRPGRCVGATASVAGAVDACGCATSVMMASSVQLAKRLSARRARSRSAHVGAISRAAGMHFDCGFAALAPPIGCQAMTHRVAAITSSAASAATPADAGADPESGWSERNASSDCRAEFRQRVGFHALRVLPHVAAIHGVHRCLDVANQLFEHFVDRHEGREGEANG